MSFRAALLCCQLCGRPAFLACPGCEAVYYCGEKHRKRHSKARHDKAECVRLRRQRLSRSELLKMLPSQWNNSLQVFSTVTVDSCIFVTLGKSDGPPQI